MTAWAVFAIVFAIVGLSIENDPVRTATPSTAAYNGGSGVTPAQHGPPAKVKIGQEGRDTQLAAGATPAEIAAAQIKTFKANTGNVRNLFQSTLGNRGRGGLRTNQLLDVQCNGGNCALTYRPDGPGVGRVIETQGPLWDTFVKDPKWQSATITAVPALHGNGKPRHGPNIVIKCTRAGVQKIGKWGVQATPKIRHFCTVGG